MNFKTIILATAVAVLASCGSSKKAAEATSSDALNAAANTTKTTTTATTKTATTQSAATTKDTSTSKKNASPVITVSQFISDLDLSVGYGNDHYNLGGKLAMKRDQVVRMRLTFMGFIEVGVIEFTPDYVLIINRMGKEFTKATYTSVDALKKNNITFKSIETMAWEKLYSTDGKKINSSDLDSMVENLINSNMKGNKKVTVHIEIGKPNTTKDFETYTTVKSSYKQVPVNMLMTQLMNFAK